MPIDSDLTWKKVSLFTHEFNEVIAKTAFEGGLHGYNLSTTSPEYGTDGTFAKCWVREDGIIKLMKRGSTGARKAVDMFIFDAIIFNEDRHKGNFGFLLANDSNEILDMAPLFDHNIAMLCYAEQEDFERIDAYLREKGPRIGDDFVETARALLYPEMRKKLQNLEGFRFERHPKHNLPEERLACLEEVVNRQIRLILE